jgi:uncharacterized HAD superfamily protein
MSEDTPVKQVSKEFRDKVIQWVEIDDKLREYRNKTKNLTKDKKEFEGFILNYLEKLDENAIAIRDGKLSRSVTKTKAPLKKENIKSALLEITGDAKKAEAMTEHIINSRPEVEKINLKRTKIKAN